MFSEEVNAATGSRRYTPRLLLLDPSGQNDGISGDGDAIPAWDGNVEKHIQEPEKGMKKCKLDCDVDAGAWSSMLRVPLNRRSRIIVPERSISTAVDFYPFGLQVWEEKKVDIEDALRYFAEDCDSIQGFHLLSDWSTGFGALAVCIAEFIADEYASKSIIAFPASTSSTENHVAAVNTCLALDGMASNTSLVCPLALSTETVHPWYSIAGENPHIQSYEASTVVAASVLDTVTLFYRGIVSPSCSALCVAAGAYGRKLGVLSASLPLPVSPGSPLSSTWKQHGGLHALLHPLTPFFPNGEEDVLWSDILSLRGVAFDQPLWPNTDPRFRFEPRVTDLLAEELSAGPQSYHHHHQWSTSVVEQPLPLYPPSSEPAPPTNVSSPERLLQLPMCTSLQSRSGAGQVVAHLQDQLAHIKLRTMPPFSASQFEEDSIMELMHSLSALRECYRTSSCSED